MENENQNRKLVHGKRMIQLDSSRRGLIDNQE